MCNNPIYKPREEEVEGGGGGGGEAVELLRGGERFAHATTITTTGTGTTTGTSQEPGTNYRTLLEKEQEWSLAVSSSQLNTIVAVHPQHPAGGGLGGAAAAGGGGGGGGGCPRDRDRPPPCAVGFVDCLYGTVPKLKELHVHPPGMQYPDLQQDARLKETLLFAAGKGFSEHQTPTSEYLELRAKLQTKPDYLEVLEKTTYRF